MISGIFILLFGFQVQAAEPPDTVSIGEVYQVVSENYPLNQKKDLQEKITDLRTRIARAGYYPELTVSARASYQSDVTSVNFVPPGAAAPEFSKDQYRFAMELSQPVYSGGATAIRKDLESASGEAEMQRTEVALYQVREQVNQVYFSILLLQKQAESIRLLDRQLRDQLANVRSKVRNGVLLPSQADILEAELVKTEQDSIRTAKEIRAAYGVLSELTGMDISVGTPLEIPETEISGFDQYRLLRPEYALFESNREVLENKRELSRAQQLPKLSAFVITAYGRPGLDVFNDDLQAYYIVGLQLQWDFKSWLNGGKETEALHLQKRQLAADEEAFSRQVKSSLARTKSSIQSLEQVLEKDRTILRLRENVVKESKSQLNNGTITATEFLTELTKANQARLTYFLHRIQLQQEKMEYITKMGISWN